MSKRKSLGQFEDSDVVHQFSLNQHPIGKKVSNKFYCDQTLFKRSQPNNAIVYLWALHKPGGSDHNSQFLNLDEPDFIRHYVESGVFESSNGQTWKIRFMAFKAENGKINEAKMCFFAKPNEYERFKG